ncbi:hypothetical protein [Alloactinosynnema sp. L-07]|nr:hypothetical protein [Alloactinosynnema sp. L-07]
MGLQAARTRAAKTGRQVCAAAGMSLASLSRTENGKRAPSLVNVAALLAIYGVTGDERDDILDLAAKVHEPHWLETGDQLPRLLPALAGFEAEAKLIVHFAPFMVPGLLQTPAYMRSMAVHANADDLVVQERIEARLKRQEILGKIVAPQYVALLDEAALRRPFGGSEVMVQQLHWLIGRAQQPNITIRVIPFRHGGYMNPGMYSLMEFREAPPIVYVEAEGASGFLDGPKATQRFRSRTATLEKIALGSADSVNFLTRMVADYERS